MQPKSRLRLARFLARLCLATMLVLPVGIAVVLAFWSPTPAILAEATGLDVASQASTAQLWSAVAVGLIPVALLIWVLHQMRHLFLSFGDGQVLTSLAAQRIRKIGQGFLALALIPLIVQPAQSVLLSWNAVPGERQVSIGLSSEMLGFAFVSGLMIVIGWAIGQAAVVAEENRAFV